MAQDNSTTDPVILDAQRSKAQSDALKAAADAKTAALAAQTAATQAAVGTVPDSGFTGKVDVQTDGGKAEATLLAARTANLASSYIASKLASQVKGKTVRIYVGSDRPTLDHWAGFNLRLQLLKLGIVQKAKDLDKIAVEAVTKLHSVPPPAAKAQIAPALALGLAVTTIAKLGALFQSDYSAGNVALTPDNDAIASGVSDALLNGAPDKPGKVIISSRTTISGADASLQALLTELATSSSVAPGRIAVLKDRAAAIRASADAKTADFIAAASACDEAVAAWQAASTDYDALVTSVTTPDASGTLPLSKIAAEKQLADALAQNDLVLILQMNAAVGSYMVKKNLWTFFNGEPFYLSGGTIVSYTLVGGKDGETMAAGVIPIHGGYLQAPDVQAKVNAGLPQAYRP